MISVRDRTGFDPRIPGGGVVFPAALRDAVEHWARQHGTHGRIVWNPTLRCAEVQLDLKPDDPRMKAYREGRWPVPPVDSVFLHRQSMQKQPDGSMRATGHYIGIPPAELGVEFVVRWLDEGNLLSGRGRHASLDAACKAADRRNAEVGEKIKEVAVENARLRARDERRRVAGNPLVAVPDNLIDNVRT